MSELAADDEVLARVRGQFERALGQLAEARPFAKPRYRGQVFNHVLHLLRLPGGTEIVAGHAGSFGPAGVFTGSDWDHPEKLRPPLVRQSLLGPPHTAAVEAMSELRLLAAAKGEIEVSGLDAEGATGFLEGVLAWNLDLLDPAQGSEALRNQAGPQQRQAVANLLAYLLGHLDPDHLHHAIFEEAQRLLMQRPIHIRPVQRMLALAGRSLAAPEDAAGARGLLAAAEAPTERARAAADPDRYVAELEDAGRETMLAEARTLAVSMLQTGLVAPAHAALIRYAAADPWQPDRELLAAGLGLLATGRASLADHGPLVGHLIAVGVGPATPQSCYGLSQLLERGTLFFTPVPPGLWRLLGTALAPAVQALFRQVHPDDPAPDPELARRELIAGTVQVLGQPLGIGQGDNPSCQAARAISLWAQNNPGYLLALILQAARDTDVELTFEGQTLHSSELAAGLVQELHTELDPVSILLVPHLDRIYIEMGRRTYDRGEDGHRWINPEFHGWWVGRGFATPIVYGSGAVRDFEGFLRRFYATYHPQFNGGRGVMYPQPAGIAATDIHGAFIGWHAIAIQRIAPGPDGTMRVYFFNPNNDSGQDWGQGIVTSTHGNGEFHGESSLPVPEFAARLYLFHYDPREQGDGRLVPAAELAAIAELVRASWARGRSWLPAPPEG